MRWLTTNWIWIVVIGGMLWMHLGHGGMHGGGHGGMHGGGHGGHGARRPGDAETAHGGHGRDAETATGDDTQPRRRGC